MARPKSRLNEIIDGEILRLFQAEGAADASDIYDILRLDHDEMVQAEVQEDARRGLMRRIELRLKQFITQDKDSDQISLPGISFALMERIDEVITVPRDGGSCSYLHIHHRNTTVGDVLAHIEMLRSKEDSIKSKASAWREVVQRCGKVDLDTPLIVALAAVAPPPPPPGQPHRHEARP